MKKQYRKMKLWLCLLVSAVFVGIMLYVVLSAVRRENKKLLSDIENSVDPGAYFYISGNEIDWDKVLKGENVDRQKMLLCMSAFFTSLKNQDAVYIADRMIRVNPEHSCALTMSRDENPIMKRMKKINPDSVICHSFERANGFISVNGSFAYFSLLYKAFTGDADFSNKLALSPESVDNYTYRCVD